jgi:hypothetical protein
MTSVFYRRVAVSAISNLFKVVGQSQTLPNLLPTEIMMETEKIIISIIQSSLAKADPSPALASPCVCFGFSLLYFKWPYCTEY